MTMYLKERTSATSIGKMIESLGGLDLIIPLTWVMIYLSITSFLVGFLIGHLLWML